MAQWMVVRLSESDINNLRTFRLQGQFEALYTAALAPKDAALFGSKKPAKDNHLFYFSQKAAEIFATLLPQYHATPCSAPLRESVSLLIGHADAIDLLTTT
jgi:hypothetical protein